MAGGRKETEAVDDFRDSRSQLEELRSRMEPLRPRAIWRLLAGTELAVDDVPAVGVRLVGISSMGGK